LIQGFLEKVNLSKNLSEDWQRFVLERKAEELAVLIAEENLKEEAARHFLDIAFRDGLLKTTGTDMDKIMPSVSRFGGGNRAEKKDAIIVKLRMFFDKYSGLV